MGTVLLCVWTIMDNRDFTKLNNYTSHFLKIITANKRSVQNIRIYIKRHSQHIPMYGSSLINESIFFQLLAAPLDIFTIKLLTFFILLIRQHFISSNIVTSGTIRYR